jgi:hypothetical protein
MLGKFRPVEQNAALNNRLRCFPDHSQLPIAFARADVDDNWNIDRTRAIKLPYLDGEACFCWFAADLSGGDAGLDGCARGLRACSNLASAARCPTGRGPSPRLYIIGPRPRTTVKPQGVVSDGQPGAREGQAGRRGVAEHYGRRLPRPCAALNLLTPSLYRH